MIAYFFIGCTSIDASGAVVGMLSVGWQPAAYAQDVSAVLAALIVVVTALGIIEQWLHRHRREPSFVDRQPLPVATSTRALRRVARR